MPGDKAGYLGRVAGRERVADRLIGQARLQEPGARTPVQGRQHPWLRPGQLTAQDLREKMVIAEPLAGVIERHDEQIVPLEHADDLSRVLRPDHGVAERGAEAAENRGAGEELPDLGGLPAQYLLSEEVDDETAVAGELADEGARGGVPAQRESSEVHARGPALGPLGQVSQVLRGELGAGDPGDELRHLPGPESQLLGPDLRHFPGRPQAGQRQAGIRPGDQHELDGRRHMLQGEGDLVLAVAVPDHVVVIEHEDHRLWQPGQLVEQQGQHHPGEVRALRPESVQDGRRIEGRASAL